MISFKTFLLLSVCVCKCYAGRGGVGGGQGTTHESWFSPSRVWALGLNSGGQACW